MSAPLQQPTPGTTEMNVTRVFAWLFMSLCIGILIVIVGLAVGVRGGDVACLLWGALAIPIALIPLSLDAGRPHLKRHIFLSMLAISYTINFVLPVFTTYIPAIGPMDPAAMDHSNLLPRDIARGQWVAILGLLFLYLGYAAPIRRLVRPILPARPREWAHGPALVATSILIMVGWIVFIGRAVGIVPQALGSGWIGGIASGATFGSALLTAIYMKYRSPIALVVLVVLVPITTLIMFMTGSKTAILLPAAMVVLTWIIVQREIRLRWILAGGIAITLLYPVAQFWRQDILQNNTLSMADVARNPGPALQRTGQFLSSNRGGDYFSQGFEATGRRLDAIGVTAVIIRDTPSISPYQNGRTLALVPIGLVPRILWPGKPTIPIGNWISKTYTKYGYMGETNLAPSWIGEFYLNFGVAGVGIGMMVIGFMLRFVHEALMRPNASIPLIVAAVIVLSRLLLGIQGSLSTVINTPIIMLIPLFLMHLIVSLSGSLGPAQSGYPQRNPEGQGPSQSVV